MSEQMTSPEDAKYLSDEIHGLVNDLERVGFSRGEIGSAMAGIAIALVQVHVGHDQAMRMSKTLGALLERDAVGFSG